MRVISSHGRICTEQSRAENDQMLKVTTNYGCGSEQIPSSPVLPSSNTALAPQVLALQVIILEFKHTVLALRVHDSPAKQNLLQESLALRVRELALRVITTFTHLHIYKFTHLHIYTFHIHT